MWMNRIFVLSWFVLFICALYDLFHFFFIRFSQLNRIKLNTFIISICRSFELNKLSKTGLLTERWFRAKKCVQWIVWFFFFIFWSHSFFSTFALCRIRLDFGLNGIFTNWNNKMHIYLWDIVKWNCRCEFVRLGDSNTFCDIKKHVIWKKKMQEIRNYFGC